jgi:hypothetical protein
MKKQKIQSTKVRKSLLAEARAKVLPEISAQIWARIDRGQALTKADKRSIAGALAKVQ